MQQPWQSLPELNEPSRRHHCHARLAPVQNAAYVRALGQIELLFTFAASYLFFRERSNSTELFGIALVTTGILILVLLR